MRSTPFPERPCQVTALTVQEFMCELDLKASGSIESVCRRFLDDANRALVWFIRFRALTSWCEQADNADWLESQSARQQHACELAAAFELNDDWEFDADAFRAAVDGRAQ